MSAAEQNPDYAGEQYTSLAVTVARKTSHSEVADMPCVRKIRRAYSKPEHDDRTLVTCSASYSYNNSLVELLLVSPGNSVTIESVCWFVNAASAV